MPGIFVEMVFYPRAARKHAVSPMRDRTRPGAFVPATVGESDPRHGPETQRVSFVNKLTMSVVHTAETWRKTLARSLLANRNSDAMEADSSAFD